MTINSFNIPQTKVIIMLSFQHISLNVEIEGYQFPNLHSKGWGRLWFELHFIMLYCPTYLSPHIPIIAPTVFSMPDAPSNLWLVKYANIDPT